jgi:Flp pilus assembly protein TadD
VQAQFGKAVALQLLRRHEEAETAYERLLALQPDSEEALGNWVALAVERNDLVSIHRRSLRLLDLRPDSPIALQGLLLVALERQDFRNAAGYADRLRTPAAGTDNRAAAPAVEYRLPAEAAAHFASRHMAAGE